MNDLDSLHIYLEIDLQTCPLNINLKLSDLNQCNFNSKFKFEILNQKEMSSSLKPSGMWPVF